MGFVWHPFKRSRAAAQVSPLLQTKVPDSRHGTPRKHISLTSPVS
jgi:hypothetical protein